MPFFITPLSPPKPSFLELKASPHTRARGLKRELGPPVSPYPLAAALAAREAGRDAGAAARRGEVEPAVE